MELGISFSSDTYETIQVLLEADDECKIDGLKILSDTLAYGNAELLSSFPCSGMSKRLVQILNSNPSKEIAALTSQCIFNFLDAHPSAPRALAENQALSAMGNYITEETDIDVGRYLIKSLSAISEHRPNEMGKEIGLEPFLKLFDKFRLPDKVSAAVAMDRITANYSDTRLLIYIQQLFDILLHSEENVMVPIVTSIKNIIQKINVEDLSQMDKALISRMVDAINVFQNGKCVEALLRCIVVLSRVQDFAEILLEHQIDYQRVLFDVNYAGNTQEIKRLALNVAVNLLPDVELPDKYWKRNNRQLNGTPEFARTLQPLLVNIILSKAGWETLTLAALAATMIVRPLEFNSDLLNAMAGLVRTPLFAPFVLLNVIHLQDPSIVVQAGILPLFKNAKPESDIAEWYKQTLDTLLEKLGPSANEGMKIEQNFTDFTDLCKYVMKTELKPYEFLMSGLLQKATTYLEEIGSKRGEPPKVSSSSSSGFFSNLRKRIMKSKDQRDSNELISSDLLPAITKMVDLSFDLLMYLPIPRMIDPLSSYAPEVLLQKSIKCNIKTPEETVTDVSIGIDLDFSGLEAWYNLKKERATKAGLVQQLKNSEYKDIVIIENPDDLYFTQRGLFNRALNMPELRRYHFKVNDKTFSVFDSFFHSIARSLSDPDSIIKSHSIEMIEGDCPRAPLNVPKNIHEETKLALNFLQVVHALCPSISVKRPKFQNRILAQMSSPLLTIGFLSNAAQIIYHYPFLFDFDIRHTFFRIIGLDLSYSLPFINHFFYKVPWNHRMNSMRVKCHIRRNSLFEDGLKMLQAVGPGMLRIDVFFDNEEGIGAGPTQEFLTLFCNELCKVTRGLWRFDSTSDSEFCFSKKGLFPRPDADPKLFSVLGLLVGKAILMDMILPLPLNPAFFKMIRGDTITVSDVDEAFAKSLDRPEGLIGLAFTYPGLPDFELCPGGKDKDVTKSNLKEYVDLIKKATIELTDITNAFREAFSTIVQWETLKVLSNEEICLLIEGQNAKITEDDLKSSVVISHGYTEDSPQVQYLFETILEMDVHQQSSFIKFITGCEKLPIGGLKKLQPNLTIAVRTPMDKQKPDDSLPSVLTCANYLKVPQYSSKEILKDKLLYAIHECQDSFLLT